MNINVTRTEVIVGNGYIVNKGEYKINPCVFTFSQEYTNLVKKAVFDDGKTTKEMAIINNRCELPYEVLDSDSFQLRVYAYRVNEQELELVYSPTPAIIYLREGSYRGVTGSGEIITPTQYEQYEQALNDGLDDLEAGLQEVSNVDIDVSKSGNTATVTITDRQGTEKSVEIFDGDDYVLTEEDKQEIINTVEAEVSLDIPTKVSQLENDSAYINKEVNNLTNYTLKTNTGSSIELSINSSTYVMTLNLKNSAGTTISTGTIDLPLETMVVGATYDNTNKKIVLTLKNGSTIDVPVADLVSGLQSEINSNNKLSSDLVDDTNHTNKFVTTSEKEQITTNATDISNIKDGTSIDSFGDVETALSGKEDSSNKTGVLNSSSTTAQYPHAKAVYDELVERDEEIEALYNDHPDITDTGTDITLQGTGDLKMKVDVGGNSTQDGEPSPENKVDINNVEGDVVVISKNSDNTKSNTVTFPLSQGQKLMLGDTLEDDGIHHKRGQIDLSTITFSVYATNKYRTNRLQNIIKKPVNDYVVGEIIAEKYLPVSNDTSFVNGNIAVDRFGTINLYDTTGTPSGILEYALAEETIEAYTSAQQTAYNKLKEMQSYYDLTYVTGSSDNAQPILTAHAKKSLKVMQSEIDELKQAILNS